MLQTPSWEDKHILRGGLKVQILQVPITASRSLAHMQSEAAQYAQYIYTIRLVQVHSAEQDEL